MAETLWRCSQCGAINEPGSRACQNCGKWPSLFDLQDPVVDELESVEFERTDFDPTGVETFDPETFDPETFEPGDEADDEPERARWKSILSGVVVPLALLIYFAIALLSDR